ncbi:TadE/TadG family type IV pilus assembly protein [Sphingomonas bacterium]|uniref:TadE/TadG family type IV pilus assembly protein n=1 Tax=Sphingomonas bacterium TaxID=1895847 RepID=UPI001576D66F|nr:TadE/TadG family type IV pilus assembly protein [Sphingomonas bacterium]
MAIRSSTFLGRLARDRRGNTLAMMAAAMVPLIGFAGSAIDFARIYVVKARLQQACDAGVLAGRKAMTDTSLSTPLDSTAKTQANTFFANNFGATYDTSAKTFSGGWYRTTNVSFTPTKASDGVDSTVANTVQGAASTTLPMAVMSFFGINTRDLVTTCQARFDLADTDVMFVLDTTGSMSCVPSASTDCANAVTSYSRSDGSTGYYNQESSGSKIDGVRQAVVLFDKTMRDNADSTTHFRYGFVTYSSAVNVGKVIPAQYLQNTSWTYQTRHLSPTVEATSNTAGDYVYGNTSSVSFTGVAQASCVAQRLPATGFVRIGPSIGSTAAWADAGYYQARYYSNVSWTAANGGTCSGTQQPLRALWRYEPQTLDISRFATGATTTAPGRLDGLASSWHGCVEEVDTSAAASFSLGSLPDDLNPDFKPSATNDKWRPAWPEAEWTRGSVNYTEKRDQDITEDSTSQYENLSYRAGGWFDQHGSAACGMPAQRLKVWTAQQVHDYVYDPDFKPFGGTYHDVGMIWGTRMLSPDSVFADSVAWPGRNAPSRNIVFMTDGEMSPSPTSYGQYGAEYWDKRVTNGDYNSQLDRHNARFAVECDAAKKKGITIYVIALGVTINSSLTTCASPGQTFQASSTDQLTTAFKTIAQRVAMLRLTQ